MREVGRVIKCKIVREVAKEGGKGVGYVMREFEKMGEGIWKGARELK